MDKVHLLKIIKPLNITYLTIKTFTLFIFSSANIVAPKNFTQLGIKLYQKNKNLPITGHLDEATKNALKARHCGTKDYQNYNEFNSDITHLQHSKHKITKRFTRAKTSWFDVLDNKNSPIYYGMDKIHHKGSTLLPTLDLDSICIALVRALRFW